MKPDAKTPCADSKRASVYYIKVRVSERERAFCSI